MNLILAVRATLDSDKLPGVPPEVKDAARPFFGSRTFWVVLAVGFVLWLVLSKKTGAVTKFIAAGCLALFAAGWDAQPNHGVASAIVGSKENGPIAILAAAIVMFIIGVWRIPDEAIHMPHPGRKFGRRFKKGGHL